MRRILPACLVFLTVGPLPVPTAQATLAEIIDAILIRQDVGTGRVAISVREADSGTTIVEINANEPYIPASNLKLLTTGAALHVLGPEFRFETRLLREDDRLIILGSGDPAFGDPKLLEMMSGPDGVPLDVESFLNLWVDRVEAAGIDRIEELVLDDRIFDRQFVHATWPPGQLNRSYCAQVSGFSFHLNQLYFYPEPRLGGPSTHIFVPKVNWLEIYNRGNSAADLSGWKLVDEDVFVWAWPLGRNFSPLRRYRNSRPRSTTL